MSFQVNVAGPVDNGVLAPVRFIGCGLDDRRLSTVRVDDEVLDHLLDDGAEEIALECRDTFRWLGRNEIDPDDPTVGSGTLHGDLHG